MGKGLATIDRKELELFIVKKYDLPGAEIKNISYDYETDSIKVAVEHESIKGCCEGAQLPWLEEPKQIPSDRGNLYLQSIFRYLGNLGRYDGNKKPIEENCYQLLRSIAGYLLEQGESK